MGRAAHTWMGCGFFCFNTEADIYFPAMFAWRGTNISAFEYYCFVRIIIVESGRLQCYNLPECKVTI